ncbi:hypothetical protein BaRGS_00033517 [Batillaria attramentaria]|uniref:Beta-glucuronidase n=1 Tax=Batillaria attramentaria TaxID=370345 RepID=A0ABD0JKE5_9CAEN
MMRFGSAHYYAMVWVNGQEVMTHDGGHLPFEGEINSALNFDGPNRVTVAVNNTLLPTTLPPGQLEFKTDTKKYPPGYFTQVVQMDFFNYAGIHRHVHLYTKPKVSIDDITIVTTMQGTSGVVTYGVMVGGTGSEDPDSVEVAVLDRDGQEVGHTTSRLQDTIAIPQPRLWWPYTMRSDDPGYMYTLKVNVSGDVYRQPFGIRTIQVTDSKFLINSLPFYCLGVAKHEDSDIRGKGLDYPLIARDFNMLKWLGVNCFRTSHYPYAEEIMDQADQQGIVVIDESPGVGIVRLPEAEPYFREVIEHTRAIDVARRPVTFVANAEYETDRATQFVDVICVNRYFGWYSDMGHTEVITLQLSADLEGWHAKHPGKPIIITEYGADTVEPSFVFTEEYQVDFMSEYHATFDKYRAQYLVGEMVWNFADFMTVEGLTRVVGNRKGVLTRQRQPKASGHLLRQRYLKLGNNTFDGTAPTDLPVIG